MAKQPLSTIQVVDRERKDLGNMDELMESIVTWGQLMPLLVRKEDNRLIDGGRRYEAMTRLEMTEAEVLYREDITDEELKILEFETNERRKAMTWFEKVRGIRKIHKMRSRTSAIRSQNWTYQMTGGLLGVQLAQVSYAIMVADALDDPNSPCHKATSIMEAVGMLAKAREDAMTRMLAQSTGIAAGVINRPQPLADKPVSTISTSASADEVDTLSDLDDLGAEPTIQTSSTVEVVTTKANQPESQSKSLPIIPLSEMFFNLPAEEFLPMCSDSSVDHFITDPPYGIDMSNLSQGNTGMDDIERVADSHKVEPNLKLIKFFVHESYRILRDGGWTILWYDLDHHNAISNWALDAGYSVMRWPFFWIKTHPCLNQQAAKNWTKSTEQAMCLRKGNATLISQQPTNYIAADGRIDRAKYKNPFAKPMVVWQALMNAVAIRGQIVCDPFGGEFSGPLAAIQLGLRPLSCEPYEHHYNTGLDHVKRLYMNLIGEVEFK